MPRDITPESRAVLLRFASLGYRTSIAENAGLWYATAKRDSDGQFHIAKAESEVLVVAALAELTGVSLSGPPSTL